MVYENQDTPKLVGLTDKMNSPPPTEEKLDQEQLDEVIVFSNVIVIFLISMLVDVKTSHEWFWKFEDVLSR